MYTVQILSAQGESKEITLPAANGMAAIIDALTLLDFESLESVLGIAIL
ncbi:hypothetical protein [Dictyobacter arantiisoli]|uniref:Uncharacterized protein n=1 Tax=Dictyobacter arantiisoli TaxID=2014874 RepID=A0A5A5TIS7_9CHLR|nr:hypothetical protein [Dictyobacter arantiisoli]GCF10889.1 hypothetical protein KDI_44530 [Dictyobacter arantiisoli]